MVSAVKLKRLEPEQYPVLKEVADGYVPDTRNSVAILAVDDQGPAGRIFLLAPAHVEGIWVRPDLQGSVLGKQLMERAEVEAAKAGISKVFAYAVSSEIENYLTRLGYKKWEVTVWEKSL